LGNPRWGYAWGIHPDSKLHWRSTGSVLASSAGLLLASSTCASTGMRIGPVLHRQCWPSAGNQHWISTAIALLAHYCMPLIDQHWLPIDLPCASLGLLSS